MNETRKGGGGEGRGKGAGQKIGTREKGEKKNNITENGIKRTERHMQRKKISNETRMEGRKERRGRHCTREDRNMTAR